ncbi:sensor histidine kinase [Tessaracoccus caeni]|uniref:sensor histidine kinase n=1 Tax=Tessaracoccus caeni TaxID=3031239 RepID=UPI0023DC9021|nr:HAMP domain-containing sensor histidine kinase [Tessaracoccus caeni]MDF1488393.1 HAMP domain-containing sensor histidine kinase [Tessaracoccus caeni]
MRRRRGLSARIKLTLSYAGFLVFAGILLLGVTWYFQIREMSVFYLPTFDDFLLVFDPGNFGPRIFTPAAMLVLLGLLLVGLAGGWILAGRMLAPLTRITSAARQAANGSLTHRVALEGRGDEFRELADAFDTMLAKLEAQLVEQQRFAANASHELRTPLAVMQTILDVASKDPSPDGREERLRSVNARAIALTEALLLLSRADQRSFVPEHVDLSLLAEQAAETMLPLAEKNHVVLEITGPVAFASGSSALLLQMVTNLMHNAIVHNLPTGGSVQIVTTAGAGFAELTVENTGEQLSTQLVSTLTEPFRRGTDRIRSDQAGVGLGLAIVSSIVTAHDGTLTLTPRTGGGLRVTVHLPL